MTSTRRAILQGALALAATATQATAATTALQADCRRGPDGRLQLSWTGPAADVRLATTPDGPFTNVVARGAQGEWTGAAPVTPRPYFRLTTSAGAVEVAERVLPLQGGRNFRDLGGYRTADGRMVRWGQLYRSGTMVDLTDGDYAYLSALGIKVMCDFRTTAERTQEPTRWRGSPAPSMYTIDYAQSMEDFTRLFAGSDMTAAKVRAQMAGFYETMPYAYAEHYRRMFAELVAGRTPLSFNCSAGKDRTGVAAGLLLTILGVPRADVLADYALTEKVVDYEAIARRQAAAGGPVPAGFESIAKLPADVRAPLMRSDPLYLEAALTTVEKREGSVAAFLDKRLGVSPAQVQILRDRLLKRV